ncbi:unnamed protein product [Trichobilharzia szidati]|nr:unnamed protein product [Trichobilharzia szidati]
MNQGLANVYRDRLDSIASQNSNNMEILDSLKFRSANQTGDCEKGYYEGIPGTTAIPQPLPPPPTTTTATTTTNAVNIQQQQQPLPEDISDFGGDIDVDGDDIGVGIDDDVDVDLDGCDELNVGGVDEDDVDDDNTADLIDGQLNHQESTLCPKCFQHCNRICQNIFYCCSAWSPLGAFMQDLLSPKLLLSPTFLFFLFSSMTAMLGLVIPFLMLPDLLSEMNWKLEDSGFIISSIGAGNTFGRLFATFYIEKAWSTTYKWADSLWMNNISLLLTSITVFTLPTIRRYYAAVVLVSCGFGLFSAVFVSLKSILVVELIGIDRLTNAFGYLLLFQGCAAAIGPPVAGYLRDKRIESLPPLNIFTADTAPVHNASAIGFLFAGTALFISCLLGCPLRWLSRKEYPAEQPSNTLTTYNPNEFLPNHIDPTNFNYEYNTTSPVLTGDHEYMQLPEYHQGVEINEPGSARRIDMVDHYPGTASVAAPLSSLAVVDNTLRSQANNQLSPCVPLSSVSGVPLPASHHHVMLSTAQPTVVSPLVVVGGSAGAGGGGVATGATTTGSFLENNNVPIAGAGGSGNLTASVTDDTVQLVGVSGLKLSATGIPVPVVGGSGGGSVPTPSSVSISLPAQTVEVLEVKEDPGLEPVVEEEEEEEEYEDEEEDYTAEGLVAGDNSTSPHHHQHLDSGVTNNDSGADGFAGTTAATMGGDNLLPATNDHPCASSCSSSSSASSTSTTPTLRSGGGSRKDMTNATTNNATTTKHKRRRGATAASKPTTTATTSPTPIGNVEVSGDCSGVTAPEPTTTIPVASSTITTTTENTIPTAAAAADAAATAAASNVQATDGCNSKEEKDNGDKDENSVHTS